MMIDDPDEGEFYRRCEMQPGHAIITCSDPSTSAPMSIWFVIGNVEVEQDVWVTNYLILSGGELRMSTFSGPGNDTTWHVEDVVEAP